VLFDLIPIDELGWALRLRALARWPKALARSFGTHTVRSRKQIHMSLTANGS